MGMTATAIYSVKLITEKSAPRHRNKKIAEVRRQYDSTYTHQNGLLTAYKRTQQARKEAGTPAPPSWLLMNCKLCCHARGPQALLRRPKKPYTRFASVRFL